MSKKIRSLVIIYASAAIIVLGMYAYVSAGYLSRLRMLSGYGAGRGFEESAYAVGELSEALHRARFASDGGMCSRVCAEIYANSLYAEATLTALPFSTQELENLQGFLNTAGDYAYVLCGEAAENGFSEENTEVLTSLAELADEYSALLMQLRGELASGGITMDDREKRLVNIPESEERYLSAALSDFERDFAGVSDISYDGRYTEKDEVPAIDVPETEMREQAAKFIKAPKLAYEYSDGRRCYSDGERSVTVGAQGVESLWSSRLVGESSIELEKAEEIAASFLEDKGYTSMKLTESAVTGGAAQLRFAPDDGETARLCAAIEMSVALDDGSIYSFNASNYSADAAEQSWNISEEQARETLPDNVECKSVSRTVIKSAGGKDIACYELECDGARVYVNAETGRQQSIVLT